MKVILFDIDHTLVNTGQLIHELIHPALIKKLDINAEELKKTHDKYRSSLGKSTEFNSWEFLELLAQETNINIKKLEKIFFNKEFYPKALYKNTLPILDKYKNNYKLGIYSEGVEQWQRFKLEKSGLNKYFDKKLVFISKNKKSPELIEKLPKNAFVVDDRLDYIDVLKQRKDLYPIWLDRKCSSDKPDAHSIIALDQLEKIIK